MDGTATETLAKSAAQRWLGDFATALACRDGARIAALFANECHWRDILAFTWNLHTTSSPGAIAHRMLPSLARTAPHGLELAKDRTPPRYIERAGTKAIEAIFTFETVIGPCNGVVRLVSEGGAPRAWTLMTAPFALFWMTRKVSSERSKLQRQQMKRSHGSDDREPMSSDSPWL